MVPQTIKVLILDCVHLIWHLYNRLLFSLICIYYYFLETVERYNKTCDFMNNTSSNIPLLRDLRIPKHIALAFTNEANCLDLESIARLLCWCKQLGINYITIYDDLGRIKVKQKELFKCVELKIKSLGCEKPVNRIEGLNIISKEDGRKKFLEDVKDLAIKSNPKSINLELVNSRVGWPTDPELLISFGTPLCLYGFPPWQLRLTEIFSIPTHRKLPRKIFIDCLRSYSRTSQRVGV